MAETHESQLIAGRLNDALETLPTKTYVFIKSYTENVAPWIALALAIYAVTMDKYERHVAIERERRARSTDGAVDFDSNGAGGRTSDVTDDFRPAYPLAPIPFP